MPIGDAMSDRHFLLRAVDCTKEWEAYVHCVDRIGLAVVELQAATVALAAARDALAQAVLVQEAADVSS
jgi:hypothetical protein